MPSRMAERARSVEFEVLIEKGLEEGRVGVRVAPSLQLAFGVGGLEHPPLGGRKGLASRQLGTLEANASSYLPIRFNDILAASLTSFQLK